MENDVHIRPSAHANVVFSNGANIFQEVRECIFLVFGLTRLRMMYDISMVSDAAHRSTSQVHTSGPASLLTETPPLLAPNVPDCAEVLSLPSFTVQGVFGFYESFPERHEVWRLHQQGFVRQCRVVRGRQVPLVKGMYSSAVMSGARLCLRGTYSARRKSSSADSKIKRVCPDGNIITVASKRFSCPYFMGKATIGFYGVSFLQTSGSVTLTSAEISTTMWRIEWPGGTYRGGSIHDEIKARVTRPIVGWKVILETHAWAG